MNIKLTVHFQARMVERGIDMDHVKKAIKSPDTKKSLGDGKIIARRKVGAKTIEVVYCKEKFRNTSEQYIAITAYYL